MNCSTSNATDEEVTMIDLQFFRLGRRIRGALVLRKVASFFTTITPFISLGTNSKLNFFAQRVEAFYLFLPYLMDGHPVDIGVVNKPDDLVGEKFTIVLRGEVRFSGL
jgi:hypothetical protein